MPVLVPETPVAGLDMDAGTRRQLSAGGSLRPSATSTERPVRRFRLNLLQLLVHVPRLARGRRQPVSVLGQQQPVGDQSIHCLRQPRSPGIT
jgi:hypothetical protein